MVTASARGAFEEDNPYLIGQETGQSIGQYRYSMINNCMLFFII